MNCLKDPHDYTITLFAVHILEQMHSQLHFSSQKLVCLSQPAVYQSPFSVMKFHLSWNLFVSRSFWCLAKWKRFALSALRPSSSPNFQTQYPFSDSLLHSRCFSSHTNSEVRTTLLCGIYQECG
jgi:hypothetical protein